MAHILLTQAIHPTVQARLPNWAKCACRGHVADTLRRDAAGCSVVVVRAPLPDDIFDAAASLVGAVRHGARGHDSIEAATVRGVLVANVPGANAHRRRACAALPASPGAPPRFHDGEDCSPAPKVGVARALADTGFELRGARSSGRVWQCRHKPSRACAPAWQCACWRIRARARPWERLRERPRGRTRRLPRVLSRSDFVVLAVRSPRRRAACIGAAELAAMRPGACLVNVARGPVVQEAALIDAFAQRPPGGAALDVFEVQPLSEDHPYRQMSRCCCASRGRHHRRQHAPHGLGVVIAGNICCGATCHRTASIHRPRRRSACAQPLAPAFLGSQTPPGIQGEIMDRKILVVTGTGAKLMKCSMPCTAFRRRVRSVLAAPSKRRLTW